MGLVCLSVSRVDAGGERAEAYPEQRACFPALLPHTSAVLSRWSLSIELGRWKELPLHCRPSVTAPCKWLGPTAQLVNEKALAPVPHRTLTGEGEVWGTGWVLTGHARLA